MTNALYHLFITIRHEPRINNCSFFALAATSADRGDSASLRNTTKVLAAESAR
jgi:hypothetical protein